jgi:FkbM family methyltransferase
MKYLLKDFFRPHYFILRKIFSGKTALLEFAYSQKTYFSQFGEDIFLDFLFSDKPKGFYVDIGAYHPFNISNTYVFYKMGWRGINIEPNPISFQSFPINRPNDINLNLAVSLKQGNVLFNCLDELSGIDGDTHLFRNRKKGVRKCWVKSKPLHSIFDEYLPKDQTIDFMSVDCEGHDEQVIESNNWNIFRPSVLLVEDHKKKNKTLDKFLSSVGYRFIRELGLTKVFFESAFDK